MFKVGDKVLVVDAQDISEMKAFIGQVCTISKIRANGAYELEEDITKFGWLEKWLSEVFFDVDKVNEFKKDNAVIKVTEYDDLEMLQKAIGVNWASHDPIDSELTRRYLSDSKNGIYLFCYDRKGVTYSSTSDEIGERNCYTVSEILKEKAAKEVNEDEILQLLEG